MIYAKKQIKIIKKKSLLAKEKKQRERATEGKKKKYPQFYIDSLGADIRNLDFAQKPRPCALGTKFCNNS